MWILQPDQGKDVPQDYARMDFNERHYRVGQRAIWPNQCIPWMMLSIEERIMILENNEVYCKYCLRLLRVGTNCNSCGKGKHIRNTGYNGSCSVSDCENNVTLCKRHEAINKKGTEYTKQHWNGFEVSNHNKVVEQNDMLLI